MISGPKHAITQDQAEEMPLADAWKDPSIPPQQQDLVDKELAAWIAGQPIAPFDVLRKCLDDYVDGNTVLEIGCGVGHYYDVIRQFRAVSYTGVDYSTEMIRIAKDQLRPGATFDVMDALILYFKDRSFDVVISGCVLLHIVNWRRALSEAARVASKYLILHRTPVSDNPTQYFFKRAYGAECVEIAFNKAEMIAETEAQGFRHIQDFPVTAGQETLLFERTLFHHPV